MHRCSRSADSAEQLRQDLERLQNLVSLYERASPLVPEDMEVIRQYKDFINYGQIQAIHGRTGHDNSWRG